MHAIRVVTLLGLLAAARRLVVPGSQPVSAGAVPTCDGIDATIFGKSGSIKGTNGPDVIVGSDGDDVIKGNGGNDVICGGYGNDTIDGNSGNDAIYGDFLNCFGEGGNDTIRADAGNDVVQDMCGINDADGGSGADQLDITGTARGGSGNDEFVNAFGDIFDICYACFTAYAFGGPGNDTVYVEYGVADGGSGNDRVFVDAEGDVGHGGPGNDTVIDYLDYPATLDGGSGRDTCVTAGAATVTSCEHVTSNIP